jgi:glucosamine--fructose-6-phosphate aminotransferase (isomerizing)
MTLREEIQEQPDILESLVRTAGPVAADAAALLMRGDVTHVMIAARGTSDNAARFAKYAWGALGGLPVALAAPSLFGGYKSPPDLRGAAVVGISQSGQSPDLLAVLEEGNRQHRPTVAITNEPDSPLGCLADVVFPLSAGDERSIAATKTYTATLFAVARIAAEIRPEALSGADLARIPSAASGVLEVEPLIRAAAEELGSIRSCVVLGRGYNYATAFEWALKLQEMAYVLAHPFSVADFAHGPFAVVEQDFPVLAVAMRGPMFATTAAMLERIRTERSTRLVAITDHASPPFRHVTIPHVAEALSPIPAIIAAQLFTIAIAEARSIDPQQPRGLNKVTRTT